jgi:hypothetical protein
MSSGDSFDALAKKMGGDARHAAVLRALSKTIKTEVNNARLSPRNREVRKAITKLRDECDRFTIALNGLDGFKLLYLPAVDIEVLPKVRRDIKDVKALCKQALSINPTRHAIPKPGMVICALVVCEIWASLHKRAPGHNNDKAQEACEEYWQACEQPSGNAIGRWEHHIKQARPNRLSKRYLWIAQEVTRILSEGK